MLTLCFTAFASIAAYHFASKAVKKAKLKNRFPALDPVVPIKFLETSEEVKLSSPEEYWGQHTVNSIPHATAKASLEYLDWRFREYPLFNELMNHFGRHDDEVILDYGCGPGNDVVGFLAYTDAKKIIGMDISKKALTLTSHRLSLHKNFDLSRVELIQVDDKSPIIPLPAHSVDFVYSEGVIHHTSHPEELIQEFYRVLKPKGRAAIMIYNADSLWKHLYVAYDLQILKNKFPGLTLNDAFTKSTDGEECPIALNYTPAEFSEICKKAGFKVSYAGGFFSVRELQLYKSLYEKAIADERLPTESREFLLALKNSRRGYPSYRDKAAGVGGVYWLEKTDEVAKE